MPPENWTLHSASSHARQKFYRCFIGPIPAKMFLEEDVAALVHDDDADSNDPCGSLFKVMDTRAFYFFVRQGGKPEDWDEDTRANVRLEMIKRWRDSEWIRTFWHYPESTRVSLTSGKRWIGNSFEIGNVLGVNILDRHAPSSVGHTLHSTPAPGPPIVPASSSMGAHSPVTVPSQSSMGPPMRDLPSSSTAHEDDNHASADEIYSSSSALLPTDFTMDEHCAHPPRTILKRKQDSSSARCENMGPPLGSTLSLGRNAEYTFSRGNNTVASAVHYADAGEQTAGGTPLSDTPIPPATVLSRTGSQVNESSAGAAIEATFAEDFRWGDIVLRDRMLVRVSYTKTEWLPVNFDETQNRRTSDLRYEDWAEFMVVWRKDRLELYEDYTIPGKEMFTGHKNLAFLIPLKSERTSISLYSFADLTFCVLCPPTPVQEGQTRARALFHRSKEGTNVFVFKVKSRTRAQDWMWHLWRYLGGEIPASIEIRCPSIETRLKIDIPVGDTVNVERAYEVFSQKYIIKLVRKALGSAHGSSESTSRDWKHIIERQITSGKTLALAWRLGTQLDWIWQEEDVQGSARRWAVLSGLAFRQGVKLPHLEIRLAEHFPSTIHLPRGVKLHEPPGIEGYLDRIKSQGQARQRVYIATHDGNLFALSPLDANPPAPPTVHLSRIILDEKTDAGQYARDLFKSEVERGTAQIQAAYGIIDLKNIRSVKRLSQTDSDAEGVQVEQDLIDEEDEGGPDGLAKVQDKTRMRLKRSFEIALTTGAVVRFEAYSCRNCLEWVSKLLDLVRYWTQRNHVDAKEEMDVTYSTGRRLLLTPHHHRFHKADGYQTPPEPPIDPGSSLPALSSLYHWCSLDNCRSILKAGRVFTRKGLRGQYKLVQLFLVSGHLVQYHVSPRSSLHHRRRRNITLMDAYVCSGYLAALALRRSEYDPYALNTPRRYHDGLEADEPEEDVLFVLLYRDSRTSNGSSKGSSNSVGSIPPLSAKHKTVVFRTRSKIERDAWCWALGCEIDKIVRSQKDREQKLRETGGLINISR